jgi:sporulation protein YlmC with PRC-barrel domain
MFREPKIRFRRNFVQEPEQPTLLRVFSTSVSLEGRKQMFAKYVTAGLIGSAMLASAAFAADDQMSATPRTTAAPAPVTASDSSFTGDWRASKVVGLNVYNDNNESIGSINELLMDKSGSIKGVVISVGGFLGVGAHLVAVPYDKVKFVNEPVVTASTAPAGGTTPQAGGTSGMTGARPGPATGITTGSAPAAPAFQPNPWYPDHAVYNATKDELKAMPEFKYST